MAAGLGFKTFTTGEVLTAADTNGYLMQGILVFASAAARDAAITSPQEGQFAYLKDTNVTTYYTGSAWANVDTTGMTNPMTTTGDTIYSSSGSTPARLGIGSTGQVLTVASGLPSWATPSSGGMTLISTTTLTGSSVSLSSIPGTHKNLQLIVRNYLPASDNATFNIRVNGDTTANMHNEINGFDSGQFGYNATSWDFSPGGGGQDSAASQCLFVVNIFDYANSTTMTIADATYVGNHQTSLYNFQFGGFDYKGTNAITSLDLFPNTGNFTSGTALLYGVS